MMYGLYGVYLLYDNNDSLYPPFLTKIFSPPATSELQLMIPAWPNLSHSVCC